jgi:hypothetical protein
MKNMTESQEKTRTIFDTISEQRLMHCMWIDDSINNAETGDEWKQKAIQRDMIASAKKLGNGKNTTVVLLYKIRSLGEDKRLKIEIEMGMYERLAGCGINFDDFSKGEKLFDEDREKFMSRIKLMRAKAEIVDNDFRIMI